MPSLSDGLDTAWVYALAKKIAVYYSRFSAHWRFSSEVRVSTAVALVTLARHRHVLFTTSIFASSVPRSSTPTPTPTTNPNSPSASDYHTAASASHITSNDEEFYGGSSGGENTRHRWGDMEDTKTSVKPFFGIIRALDWDSHQNIGNHLLQAYVLKKLHPHGVFMSQEWKRKKGKGEDSDDDEVVDPAIANQKRFITKQWTAWPLPTHRVPREKEHLPGNAFFQQRRRINDQKTFAKRQEGNRRQARC